MLRLRYRLTVVVDPSAAVCVDVCNHIVDVVLCQVVAQVLQNPSIYQHDIYY